VVRMKLRTAREAMTYGCVHRFDDGRQELELAGGESGERHVVWFVIAL
jgi:hypothetical protein